MRRLRRLLWTFAFALSISLCLVAGFPLEAWPQVPPAGFGLPAGSLTPGSPGSPTARPPFLASAGLMVPPTSPPARTIAAPSATPTPIQPLPTASASPTPLPTATLTATSTPEGVGPETFPPGINPLTGLPVKDPSRLERRPMAVKITHYPRAVRPQWGLSLADVVYEYYIEDGLTRFIAVFYGNDASRAGPVRSGRFFDEHIFRMYRAIFVFANADRLVLDHLLDTDYLNYFVVERQDNCPPLCRDRSNQVYNAYNNLMVDTGGLHAYLSRERRVDLSRPDLAGTRFERQVPAGGLPAVSLGVRYSPQSYSRWDFEPETGRYLRWQETRDEDDQDGNLALLSDRLTGEPITADNVVVLMVPHSYVQESPEIVDIHLWGTGEAYVARDGQVFKASWHRPAAEALLRLTGPDGRPFPLKPGVTFYQVLGTDSPAWQLGDRWRFDFRTPK